jgi:cell division protein FtsB
MEQQRQRDRQEAELRQLHEQYEQLKREEQRQREQMLQDQYRGGPSRPLMTARARSSGYGWRESNAQLKQCGIAST